MDYLKGYFVVHWVIEMDFYFLLVKLRHYIVGLYINLYIY
jgi:hypothetical protein